MALTVASWVWLGRIRVRKPNHQKPDNCDESQGGRVSWKRAQGDQHHNQISKARIITTSQPYDIVHEQMETSGNSKKRLTKKKKEIPGERGRVKTKVRKKTNRNTLEGHKTLKSSSLTMWGRPHHHAQLPESICFFTQNTSNLVSIKTRRHGFSQICH